MKSFQNISMQCPACGSSEHEFLWEKNGCRIERCANCGLGRANMKEFDPKAYYTSSYFNGQHGDGYVDYVGSEGVLRKEFHSIVCDLRRTIPGGKLLEIGAAYGFFLMEAREHFDAHGVEISDDAAASARGRGLDVRTGVLTEDLLDELGPLDAIAMLDVIEHLEDPASTLRLCAERLRPGGALIVTTGDFGSLFAKATGKGWRLMTPPQHLWYFSRNSIEKMAAAVGLRVEGFVHPWKRVPISLIFYQIGRLAGRHLTPEAIDWASGLSLPVNLFDAMRVTLRRP